MLGADGIVGVRLEVEFKEWGADAAEFLAVGTAVKADDGTKLAQRRRSSRSPPTCPVRTSGHCCRPATHRWAW